jgi:hypothetical protein
VSAERQVRKQGRTPAEAAGYHRLVMLVATPSRRSPEARPSRSHVTSFPNLPRRRRVHTRAQLVARGKQRLSTTACPARARAHTALLPAATTWRGPSTWEPARRRRCAASAFATPPVRDDAAAAATGLGPLAGPSSPLRPRVSSAAPRDRAPGLRSCGSRKTVIVARPIGPRSRRAGLARASALQVAHANHAAGNGPGNNPGLRKPGPRPTSSRRSAEAKPRRARAHGPRKPRQRPRSSHSPKAPRAGPTREHQRGTTWPLCITVAGVPQPLLLRRGPPKPALILEEDILSERRATEPKAGKNAGRGCRVPAAC